MAYDRVKTRLAPDVLLVTDGHPAYGHFAREAGITHEAVNLKAGVRMRGWLQPFHGVASRYLTNYLDWRWALDGGRIKTPESLLRIAIGASTRVNFNT